MVHGVTKILNARILLMIVMVSVCMSLYGVKNRVSVTLPPEGAKIETWDWYASTLAGFGTDSRTLDVAQSGDSIYIRLYDCTSNPASGMFAIDSWIGGKVKDGKIHVKGASEVPTYEYEFVNNVLHIKHDSSLGIRYFNPAEYETWTEISGDTYRDWGRIWTVDEDVLLDYDSDKKWIHNPGSCIWVSDNNVDSDCTGGREGPLWPWAVYDDFELIYVPEGPLTPRSPQFMLGTYKDPVTWKEEKCLLLNGSIISDEGPAMHYYRLYFRVYIDGQPYALSHWEDEPRYDLWMDYGGRKTWNGYSKSMRVPFDRPFQEAYAVMVYKYKDGSEVVSAPAPIVDMSGVDEIFREDPEDVSAPVYDMSGRRVRPDRLAPGVYIRNGRKFMVR